MSHQSLLVFDSVLRSTIQSITNWLVGWLVGVSAQLRLYQRRTSPIPIFLTYIGFRPVKDEGLGVIRMSLLALPALLASAASTLSLQKDILSGCAHSDHATLQTYLSEWSS